MRCFECGKALFLCCDAVQWNGVKIKNETRIICRNAINIKNGLLYAVLCTPNNKVVKNYY